MADLSARLATLNERNDARLNSIRHHETPQIVAAIRGDESNDDNDSDEGPIFLKFVDSVGPQGIHQMTAFTPTEFHLLYDVLMPSIVGNWNIGRGRRSSHHPMDALFMAVTFIKYGEQWSYAASLFGIKVANFERLVSGFLCKLESHVQRELIVGLGNASMTELEGNQTVFEKFPYAIEALDVTFQSSFVPKESFEARKPYFSKKHGAYGYKTEIAVRPSGFASVCSHHYPGSVSDMTIFVRRIEMHKLRIKKIEHEQHQADVGILGDAHPHHWAILADKGYQGGSEHTRIITPTKKRANQPLSNAERIHNSNISSDRVLVENFFGRMKTCWGVTSKVYRYAEKNYDMFMYWAVGLTNFHIKFNKLRDEDGDFYRSYLQQMADALKASNLKRKESQKKYRYKKKLRLQTMFRLEDDASLDNESDEDEN